jgi:hypothetical protein
MVIHEITGPWKDWREDRKTLDAVGSERKFKPHLNMMSFAATWLSLLSHFKLSRTDLFNHSDFDLWGYVQMMEELRFKNINEAK